MDAVQAARWLPHHTTDDATYKRRLAVYRDLVQRYETVHHAIHTKTQMLVLCNWCVYKDDMLAHTVAEELTQLGVNDDVESRFEQWEGDAHDMHGLVGTLVEQNNGRRLRELRSVPRPVHAGVPTLSPYTSTTAYYTAYMRVLPWGTDMMLVKVGTSARSVEARYTSAYKTSDSGSVQTVPFLDVRGVVSRAQQTDIMAWVDAVIADGNTRSSTVFYYKKQRAHPNWLELALMFIGKDMLTSLAPQRYLSIGPRNEFLLVPHHMFHAYIATCCHEHSLSGVVYDVGEETRHAITLSGSAVRTFTRVDSLATPP